MSDLKKATERPKATCASVGLYGCTSSLEHAYRRRLGKHSLGKCIANGRIYSETDADIDLESRRNHILGLIRVCVFR